MKSKNKLSLTLFKSGQRYSGIDKSQNQQLAISNQQLNLKLRILRGPWKRNYIADVTHSGNEHD
jgi:hypothetical protein